MVDLMLQVAFKLFDDLSDGVCLADTSGNALYLNEAARRLLELPKPGGEFLNICALLCERLRSDAGREVGSQCPLREPSNGVKSVTFQGRHGPRSAFNWRDDKIKRAERWQDLRVRCLRAKLPFPGREEEELHIVLIEDATAEMELKRHRADWRSMVAHDLRAPLTSIFAALRLLEEIHPKGDLDGKDAELVEMSLKACRRMMELLDLYLDVAKLDAGGARIRYENVSVAGLIARAVQEQTALAAAKAVSIAVDIPPDLAVYADEELLGRVAENLLNNAIKYNAAGGSVKVSAVALDQIVSLSFKDTGPGIDSKDLPFIFDRYYQAEARRAGRIQGNGLGLTFCSEALRLMGGAICVESRPGAGSQFIVTLRGAGKAGARVREPAGGQS